MNTTATTATKHPMLTPSKGQIEQAYNLLAKRADFSGFVNAHYVRLGATRADMGMPVDKWLEKAFTAVDIIDLIRLLDRPAK